MLIFSILIVTEAPPSGTINTGAVIGGTIAGIIVLMALVIPLLGCFIYRKRKKPPALHDRYATVIKVIVRHAGAGETNLQDHRQHNYYVTCYLGNITVEEKYEQYSYMLPR